ncbi:MAG TPA: SGNH/GDSL hydrolase family protein [Pyrinomonadaceae bacterium]|jgi:hypothetical protein|nr:SGNH/GDSL hydrolase family protein [Pyrinomonadaceae bacterium]
MRYRKSEKLRFFVATWLVLLVASAAYPQSDQNVPPRPTRDPIHMLVLGDSILWGQGLKPEHKSWYLVKMWLEKKTGQKVIERIEAHSGAVIWGSSVTENPAVDNREVNMGRPTLQEEVDNALRSYPDPRLISLVLVSGCGNDVGVQNLLNAERTSDVDEMTETKCGKPMEDLLERLVRSFPAAQVILTGYYPFFSEKTRNDFVVNALARRFFKTQQADTHKMTSKEVFERLKINSKQWYETSNRRLAEAVRKTNAQVGAERVMFAKIDFPADYSFAAPKSHLWGFNRSPFRMMALFLSFGKVLLPTNDEVRSQRTASCNEVYAAKPNETIEQTKERKAGRLLCRYAALGHPNRRGALLYTQAITNILSSKFLVATPAP